LFALCQKINKVLLTDWLSDRVALFPWSYV